FSSDSKVLLTASESGSSKVWGVSGLHSMFGTYRDDNRETLVGEYSPDGTKFVTGGKDGRARLYRGGQKGELHPICAVDHNRWVTYVAFSHDGTEVASVGLTNRATSQDDTIRLWNTDGCRDVSRYGGLSRDRVSGLAYSPTEHLLAWGDNTG